MEEVEELKGFTEGVDSTPSVILGDFLPFLSHLPGSVLDELARRLKVSATGAAIKEVELAEIVARMPTAAFALEVAERSWEYVLDERIDQIVPAVKLLQMMRLSARDTSRRLYNLLYRNEFSDWSAIGALTPRDVWEWKNAGATTVIHLIVVAIEQGISAANGKRMPTSDTSAPETEADWVRLSVLDSLQEIVAWGSTERSALTISQCLSLVGTGDAIPREVQDAWQRLERIDPVSIFERARGERYDVEKAAERVSNNLEARQLEVLFARTFSLDRPRTLEALGTGFAVSRERVRQLETRVADTLRHRIQRPENQVLARAADRLRSRLGTAVPISELASDVLPGPDSPHANFTRHLLLWLGGGYEYWNGWLVKKPSRHLVDRSKDALVHLMKDALINPDEALEAVKGLGVLSEYSDAWIRSLPNFSRQEDFLVRIGGPIAERAGVVLRLRGEPMTRQEIAQELDCNERTLGNCLLADDRFRRISLTHFGLAEWGGEEYSNIVDELTQEIERRGGEARLDYLVDTITKSFGVSANSVRSYAAGRWFVRTGKGTLRINRDPTGELSGRSIEFTKRAYRLDGSWSYRITVTSETLRGSGSQLPVGVATYLRVAPGEAIELRTCYANVRVSWPSLQPTLGTIRMPAEALEASVGDYLFIRFVSSGRAEFALVPRRELDQASGIRRLALEVGCKGQVDAEGNLVPIADSLGLARCEATTEAIRQRLLSRGEDDLAALMGNTRRDETQGDSLDRLTKVLAQVTARAPMSSEGSEDYQ